MPATDWLIDCFAGADALSNPVSLFEPCFRFLENHQEADLGSPGALVHWIERYYPDYVELLGQSLERLPTMHTLWMLSRILNGYPPDTVRGRLWSALEGVADHPLAIDVVRLEAQRLIVEHRST